MKRLTVPDEKIEGGRKRVHIIDSRAVREEAMTIYWALKKYEDLEVTPEQIREIDKLYAEKCLELAELKKNHGLPCEVGDTVYRVSQGEIKEYRVFAINIGLREGMSSCAILTKNSRGAVIDFELIDFGKTVFLARKEAEAKLAEMEGRHE